MIALFATVLVSVAQASSQEEKQLKLVEQLPIGSSYRQVKALFPKVSKQRSEPGTLGVSLGFISWGLTEAVSEVQILGRDATIEFNFEDGKVYGYFYCIGNLELSVSEKEYRNLQKYYSGYYGKYYEERESESNYMSASSYWHKQTFDLSITNNIYGKGRSRLCWGFGRPTADPTVQG